MQSLARPMPSPEEPLGSNVSNILVEPLVEVCNVVVKVTRAKTRLLTLEDFLSKVTCLLP